MQRTIVAVGLLLAASLEVASGAKLTAEVAERHGHLLHASSSDSGTFLGKTPKEIQFSTSEHTRPKKDSLIGGVIFGIILWWIIPVCLWNNERIAIKQYKMQLKAERWCVHIDEPSRAPLPELEGRILYLRGQSEVSESMQDDKFKDVKSEGKIKLRRVVEMYQWVEHEHSGDDDRPPTYSYTQEWRDEHQTCPHSPEKSNPTFPIPSTRRQECYRMAAAIGCGSGVECAAAKHENVKVGAYYLGDYVIRELFNWNKKDDVTAEMLTDKISDPKMMGEAAQAPDGWWYFGGKRGEIGSMRVRFEELCPGPITIVGVLAKTQTGWTFVPIMRPDAAGAGDSICAEMGGSCCVRVKELHYADEEDDEDLKADLEERPIELTKREERAFEKHATTADVKEYNPEMDMDDLCCVGPFGGLVVKGMQWMGLEEEFLGVAEDEHELNKMMKSEGDAAAQRHHLARVAGLLLLMLGAYSIVEPLIKLLTINWFVAAFGGGMIAAVLCCMSMLCSCSAFLIIVSVSWIAHRPFLASAGIATAVLIGVGLYMFLYDTEQKQKYGHASLLNVHEHVHTYAAAGVSSLYQAFVQALGTSALH